MDDKFVWINEATLINLEAISLVKFEGAEALLVFVSGDKIPVSRQDSPALKAFLESRFKREAKAAASTGGYKTGRLT